MASLTLFLDDNQAICHPKVSFYQNHRPVGIEAYRVFSDVISSTQALALQRHLTFSPGFPIRFCVKIFLLKGISVFF